MKTIQEIAKMVGVSPGTVSNALNNRKGVGRETREKIIKLAEELGYNKTVADDEPKLIRFIIFKKHGHIVSDTPFFSEIIEGIERECRADGYEMLVSHIIQNEENDVDINKIVKEGSVSGVLLLATEMDEKDLKPFENLNIPIVLLDSYFRN
jgi:DNA-binding LacI/PurR family transcriptional regulator